MPGNNFERDEMMLGQLNSWKKNYPKTTNASSIRTKWIKVNVVYVVHLALTASCYIRAALYCVLSIVDNGIEKNEKQKKNNKILILQ